jgi:hypothetical protein
MGAAPWGGRCRSRSRRSGWTPRCSGEAAGGPDRGGAGGLPVGRIWNRTDRPVLRLITCGGSFDRETGHYRDNVIVYAIT